jgi:hypothetical protein
VKLKSLQLLCRNAGLTLAGSLTLAVVATASHAEKVAAIELNFNTTTQTQLNTNPFNFNFGPGVGNSGPVGSSTPTGSTAPIVVNYTNVATISPGVTIDARVTATTFGAGYSFVEHIPNYSVNTVGQPVGDTAFLYQMAANQTGLGGMTYKIDLFNSGSNFTSAYTAADLKLLAYDVDGETPQGEAVRVFKNSGLHGYQTGSAAGSLIATEDANSYLFTGRNANIAETNPAAAAIFLFKDVNSVTFQFEADTRTATANNNPVFSAIDGDLSIINRDTSGFAALVDTSATAGGTTPGGTTAVPEPFTVIGSIIGGTAAFRMRKKLKAGTKA